MQSSFTCSRSTPLWSLTPGSGTRFAHIKSDYDSWQIRKTEELSLSLTKKEVGAKLMEAVGRKVAFNYPGGGKDNRRGILKERVICWSAASPSGAKYWDVVDLIEFHGDKHRLWIRIGYYRQVGDKLRWASQTTITEPVHIMKRL